MLDFRKLWDEALTFDEFVAACKAEHCGLWQGVYNLARVPEWALAAVSPRDAAQAAGDCGRLVRGRVEYCADPRAICRPGSRARAPSHHAGQVSRGHGPVSDQRLALDPDRDRAR